MFRLNVRHIFRGLSVVVLLGVVVALAGIAGTVAFVTSGLPDVKTLKTYQHSHASEVFSDDGRKIGEFTTERRYPVRFEEIPKHVIQAFLAAEDSHFYEHHGIDYNGIIRAVFSNILKGRYAQGASTITQQVARALLLETKKKELTRKVREIVLSMRMERELSKNEILNLYLAEIYLGHGAYGIGAAARNYFGKKVSELNYAEASLLAGLPQRPNEWNPFHNANLAKRRQAYVLKRMVDDGFITDEQSRKIYNTDIHLKDLEEFNDKAAPYFVEYVRQYLMKKYGSENVLSRGYKVYTTVRYEFQKAAEQSIEKGLRDVDKRLGWRGVVQNLQGGAQTEAYKKEIHERILEDLNPPRVLPATAASGLKKLEFDLTGYYDRRSNFVGQSPVKAGEYYSAIVSEIRGDKKQASVDIGYTNAVLPFSGVEWVKLDKVPVRDVAQVLKVGDVIVVKVEKTDKKANVAEVSLAQEPEIQGALLSYETETGFVRAMVGGRDFKKTKFNCALQAKRQVGSTFKPLIYAAAVDKGFSPASIVTDSPIAFRFEGKADEISGSAEEQTWKPQNFGNKFEGDVPLRTALIRSMNIPTVKLLNEITIDYGIQYARTLGITAPLPRDLTIGLGSWSTSLEEIMRAYAIFPRLGKPVTLHYITRIEDQNGEVLEQYSPDQALTVNLGTDAPKDPPKDAKEAEGQALKAQGLVIAPQTAYVMTDMLKGVVREGTGTGALIANKSAIAGKTGTSQDHRDAWFIGYTPQLMAGVWIGYEKDKPLDPSETGGKAAAPIWGEFVKATQEKYAVKEFPIPDDIVFAYIDRDTGRLAGPNTPHRVRVAFKTGTVPNQYGDNVLRVQEPGVRGTATGEPGSGPDQPNVDNRTQQQDETNDFVRQGYQE